jgi:mevalonate kinase
MEKVGRGRAKLLLFGEHSAVYGFPAIGLGLSSFTEIRAVEQPQRGWRFPGLEPSEEKRLREFLRSTEALLPSMRRSGGELRISSTIPRGLGFGSSAALCVALAETFAPKGSSPEELWSLAHRAETYFHGRPSGIDTGLSLLGGLRSFCPGPSPLPAIKQHHGVTLHLITGALRRRASTGSLLASLHERIRSGERGSLELIERLGEIAAGAIGMIEELERRPAKAHPALGALLGAAHEALGALGLGDPDIDRLLRAGIEGGALGGKQSGAGAGGAFFLLYDSESSARLSVPGLGEYAAREGLQLAAPFSVVSATNLGHSKRNPD